MDFPLAEMSHGLPKPVGKRIYAGTVAEHNSNKYRNTLCAKWLNENDKTSADCLPYTPTSLLTTKSHAQHKLEKRRRTPEPNFEALVECEPRMRASENYKRSQRSPLEYFRDAIDAPDDFKCPPKYQPIHQRKRAATPFDPVERFDDFATAFEPLPEGPTFTGCDKTCRDGKRKRETRSEFTLEPNNEFRPFFDRNDRKAIVTGERTKKIEMFDELGFDEFEFEHNKPPKKRSETIRTSDAMALCKPKDHFNMDLGPNFYMNDAPRMSRKRHMTPENFRGIQCEKIERRTKNTEVITMPSRSSQANPIIFQIQCENLVIANDNEYKKLF